MILSDMGEHNVEQLDERKLHKLTQALLADLRALAFMLLDGRNVMDWRHIRHVPVEDQEGRLVGLVTHRALLRLLILRTQTQNITPLSVRDIMKTDPLTVSSTTPTLEALELMRSNKVGCLPVVDDDQLVGIVTSYDFLDASARLFKEQLTASAAPASVRTNAHSA